MMSNSNVFHNFHFPQMIRSLVVNPFLSPPTKNQIFLQTPFALISQLTQATKNDLFAYHGGY